MKVVHPSAKDIEQFSALHVTDESWGTDKGSMRQQNNISQDGSMWQMRVLKLEEIDFVWSAARYGNTFYDAFNVKKSDIEEICDSSDITKKPILQTRLLPLKHLLKKRWIGCQQLHLSATQIILGFFSSILVSDVEWRITQTMKGQPLPYANFEETAQAAFLS